MIYRIKCIVTNEHTTMSSDTENGETIERTSRGREAWCYGDAKTSRSTDLNEIYRILTRWIIGNGHYYIVEEFIAKEKTQ